MIELLDKSDCSGCSACANVCPAKSITMQEDAEGFRYPSVDASTCINCGMCDKVCMISNELANKPFEKKYYLVQAADDVIRFESTSGGAFTPLASTVIDNNGAAFGAAFRDNKDFYVEHSYVTDKNDLKKFRGSKYVQSDMNSCMAECKKLLLEGKQVIFSGTPCQIAGLKLFLGKEYDNLYTVDVVCRAVPSPKVFSKYLEWHRSRSSSEIVNVKFRDKTLGYNYSTMSIYTADGKEYHKGSESDRFLRAFFSGVSDRPSCSKCKFRKEHFSDITIWDCFAIGEMAPEMNDNKGTTRLAVNSEHGEKLLSSCAGQLRSKEFFPDFSKVEKAYFEKLDLDRKIFFEDMENMNANAFFNKYFPTSLKVRTLESIRIMLYKIGIYNFAKKVWDKLKNR